MTVAVRARPVNPAILSPSDSHALKNHAVGEAQYAIGTKQRSYLGCSQVRLWHILKCLPVEPIFDAEHSRPLVGLPHVTLEAGVWFLQDGGQSFAQRHDGRLGVVMDKILAEHDADGAEIGIVDGVAPLVQEMRCG